MAEAEAEPQGPRPSGSGQRKRVSVRRNVTTNYVIAVVLVAIGFITTPILTHQLGIVRYGVWALIGSLIPFLEILELGFASATIAFVSRHLELEDDEQVAKTLNTSFLVLSVLGFVAFAGVVVFAIFLPDIITSIPKSLVGQARFLLLLLAFDMALSIPLDTFGGVLVAMQRFDLLNYSLICVTVSQAIGWVIVLWLHGGLIALGVVSVAMSLLGQAARLIMVHRLLPWFRFSFRGFDRDLVKRFTTASSWYSVGQVADAVLTLADVLIVGAAAGVKAAAIYAVAQRLAQLPVKVVAPRTGLSFVRAAELTARDDRAGLRDAIDQVVEFTLAVSIPVALAIGFLAGPAIEAYVGPLYRDAVTVIELLVIASVVQAWAVTLKLSLNGAGYPKMVAGIFGFEAVIHVGLGLFLSSRYGAVGMAEAALIGTVLMEGIVLLPLAYRWLGDSLARRGWRALRTLAIPSLVTGVVAWAVGRAGGRLYIFTDTHGRFVGLVAVAVAGIALLIVFYSVLLVSAPAQQRQQYLKQFRTSLGRLAARLH